MTTSTYDGDGNLLTSLAPGSQSTTNTWDGENRLTNVALPSGIVDSFIYNGDGQRVQKQDSTGTTNHVWDGQNILLETDASSIIQVVYSLQPELYGNLISQRRSGATSFYLFDGLGSTVQLANSAGSVSDSYLYDSFGNIVSTTGTTTNWIRFVGRLGYYFDYDLAGYYLRARYYDPSTGRFLSRDPIGFPGVISNFYEYAINNPAHFEDPSGMQVSPTRPEPIVGPPAPITFPPQPMCPPGTVWVGGPNPVPPPDGCSAPKLAIGMFNLGSPNCPTGGASFRNACNTHDNCYSICGAPKNACDNAFDKALQQACQAAQQDPALRCPKGAANFNLNFCLGLRASGATDLKAPSDLVSITTHRRLAVASVCAYLIRFDRRMLKGRRLRNGRPAVSLFKVGIWFSCRTFPTFPRNRILSGRTAGRASLREDVAVESKGLWIFFLRARRENSGRL